MKTSRSSRTIGLVIAVTVASLVLLKVRLSTPPLTAIPVRGVESPTPAESSTNLPAPVAAAPEIQATATEPQAIAKQDPRKSPPDLNAALSEARHRVRALTPEQASRKQNQGTRYFAANPGQDLVARFHDGGVRFASGRPESTWQVRLQRVSNETTAPTTSTSERVEYHHADGIVERIDNRSDGFEHSLVVPRPDPRHPGRIALDFELDGLSAQADPANPGDLCFANEEGRALLGYRKLLVTDANGRELAANMQPSARGFSIHVNANGAEFPVLVDPLVVSLEAQLSPRVDSPFNNTRGTVGFVSTSFGKSSAVEGDTAVVGEGSSVWVYVRENGVWRRDQILIEDPLLVSTGFAASLALQGDTLVVGASTRRVGSIMVGQVVIYRRVAGKFEIEQTISPSAPIANMLFGGSVAISGDTLVVGSQRDTAGSVAIAGSAYVFTKVAGQWTEQAKLIASDPVATTFFGSTLAVDGNEIAIGAFWANSAAGSKSGATYLYHREGTTWSAPTKLVPEGSGVSSETGLRVAMEDGRLFVSSRGVFDVTAPGVYVYQLAGGTWVPEGKLSAPREYGVQSIGVSGTTVAVCGIQGPEFTQATVRMYSLVGGTWNYLGDAVTMARATSDSGVPSVSLSPDTMIVGVVNANTDGGIQVGRADFYASVNGSWVFRQSVDAGSHAYNDQLGSSLAISENRVLAGCPQDDTPDGGNAGSAYVFVEGPTGWAEEAKLFAPVGALREFFGWSVALSGDRALIGKPVMEEYMLPTPPVPGAAYAFRRGANGWVLDGEFRNAASGTNIRDTFGWSVALDGDLALIGATRSPSSPAFTGEVRIYRRDAAGWTQVAVLTDPQATVVDRFGLSLAVTEDTLAVGGHQRSSSTLGTVSLYQRQGESFTFKQRLDVSGNSLGPINFGVPLALSQSALLVGGPYGTDIRGVNASGRVFAYRRSNAGLWELETMLDAPVSREFGRFGLSVAMHWDTALVGMPQAGSTSPGAGEVYVYEHTASGWQRNTTIPAPVVSTGDSFGSAVAIRGTRCVIGATGYDGVGFGGYKATDQGRIYVMNLPELVPNITSSSSFTLNRQTGLYEQTITLTNNSQQTLSGFDLAITGLPAGLTVNNASTTRNGVPVVEFRQPLAPGQSVTLVLEYYSTTRGTPATPTYTVSNIPRQVLAAPAQGGLAVDRVERLPDGSMLVEFTAVPGQTYSVQYSQDGQTWKTSPVSIRAAGNRVQWIDRGPPRTDSHPSTVSARFYKVLETTP